MPDNLITLDHVRQAAEWAKSAAAANAALPIDGQVRRYSQDQWDCGTSCCMWGAASIIAGNGPAKEGPPDEWATTAQHQIAKALMNSGKSTPEQMLLILGLSNLQGADLRGANLQDADLQGADLRGADLRGADLRGADLQGADLQDADLRGADLRGADLQGADLRGANLQDADLRGADLRGADLQDADLWGADLQDAKIWLGNVRAKLQ